VLILVDTLRADHVSAYGYERETTPALDGLARRGLRFERAISQASWTLPSLMSLFTARQPSRVDPNDPAFRRSVALAPREETLAEALRDAGYRTISVATNPYNVNEMFGLMEGFEPRHYETSAPARWVVDRAIEALDRARSEAPEKPFFLYLHLMDAHTPYEPPPPYDAMFAPPGIDPDTAASRVPAGVASVSELREAGFEQRRERAIARYDGAIRFLDAELGRLFDHLSASDLTDRTHVALVSDHGEEFWDHAELGIRLDVHAHGSPGRYGVGHGHTVFRELVHVPLILAGPGVEPGVVEAPVRLLDVAPTLLGLAGIPGGLAAASGSDLLAAGDSGLGSASSETTLGGAPQSSLVTESAQLVRMRDVELFFDTRRPGWPPMRVAPEMQDELRRKLDARQDRMHRVAIERRDLDPTMIESLRALGYIE